VLRLNLTQKFIAFLFGTSQQIVSDAVDAVTTVLLEHFVPANLGLAHLSREDAIRNHSRTFFNALFDNPEEVLFLICDGTYLYIDKPGDFEEQRKTYSLHKHRNLYKPMMIVLPSGYLIDAPGLFYADGSNNDAKIMEYLLKMPELANFVNNNDCVIYDRGFRDVVKQSTDAGLQVYMPSLLPNGQKQFTAIEANQSRRVTMVRWLVESANGRLKNVFPFFKGTIVGSYSAKIQPFFRIACSILNKFYGPLFHQKDKHERIAHALLARIDMPNLLQGRVEELGLIRMTKSWEEASATSVPDFPIMSWENLEEFTLGTYQLTISQRYIKYHMKRDPRFRIYLHRDTPKIVRAKLESRFSRNCFHTLWVEYDPVKEGISGVCGWYCQCKNGARVVGACSHIVAVS